MVEKSIETHLVRKQSQLPTICVFCNSVIPAQEPHYVEEGVTEHLHSLIARRYCHQCYIKYGEQILLKGAQQ